MDAVRAAARGGLDDDGLRMVFDGIPRETIATAVWFALQSLNDRAPGKSVEVRVPPYGAVQAVEGPGHTRVTPPNVIETDAGVWLALATGRLSWDAAITAGLVHASGVRADIADWLPLVRG